MRTPRADLALRVALLLGGLGLLAVFFVLAEATAGWSPGWRLAVLLMPAGTAFAGLIAGAELRDPHQERTRYGARRRGELGAIDLGEDFWNDLAGAEARAGASTPDAHFGVRRRNTIVSLVLTVAATTLALAAGYDALRQPDLTEVGLIAVVLLGPSSYYLVRSLVRLAMASRAIRVDGDAVTLGVVLGFAWPVRLARSTVAAVVDARAATGFVHFVVDRATGYKVRADHVDLADEVLQWFTTWWPETPAVLFERTTHTPASFAELAPTGALPERDELSGPEDDPGTTTPPRRRRTKAQHTLRRRAVHAGAVFLIAAVAMFASGWWYLSQRAANDRLLTEGVVVTATVIDVAQRRGPDRLEAAFDYDGVTYERSLSSGYFSSFALEGTGDQLDVLFDPAQPALVRTRDRRNLHELTWIALLAAGAAGLLTATIWATALQHGLTLVNAPWERRRIHGFPKQRGTPGSLVIERAQSDPPLVLRGAGGLGGQTLDSTSSWLAVGRRHVVVLPDGPDDLVITARLPSGSSRLD